MNTILNREYSCWSKHRTATAVGVSFVLTITAMVVGILIVRFTTKQTSMFIFSSSRLKSSREHSNRLSMILPYDCSSSIV